MNETVLSPVLSESERDLLNQCEAQIQDGMEAIYTIREMRLYRETYTSFEGYVSGRWGWSGRRGNQLAAAWGVVLALKEQFDDAEVILPSSEYALRPLVGLDDTTAKTVYERALSESHGQVPTHDTIVKVKRELLNKDEQARDYAFQRVSACEFAYLRERLTLENAVTLMNVLDALLVCDIDMQVYLTVVQQTDVGFITKFNEAYLSGSQTIREIVDTNYLQFGDGSAIAVEGATGSDLARLMHERYLEHRKQAQAENAGKPVSVVVYNQDAKSTYRELVRVLDKETLVELARMINNA